MSGQNLDVAWFPAESKLTCCIQSAAEMERPLSFHSANVPLKYLPKTTEIIVKALFVFRLEELSGECLYATAVFHTSVGSP